MLFNTALQEIKDMMLDRMRAHILFSKVVQTKELGGNMAELGVFRGGSAKLMALADKDSYDGVNQRTLYMFDTFTGIPEEAVTEGVDTHKAGDFSDTEIAAVKERFAESKIENYVLVEGMFPDSTEGEDADEKQLEALEFSIVHIDGDVYETTKSGLEWFYPRMLTGGIIVIDDYGLESTPGVKEAVDEFLDDKPEHFQDGAKYQIFIVKLAEAKQSAEVANSEGAVAESESASDAVHPVGADNDGGKSSASNPEDDDHSSADDDGDGTDDDDNEDGHDDVSGDVSAGGGGNPDDAGSGADSSGGGAASDGKAAAPSVVAEDAAPGSPAAKELVKETAPATKKAGKLSK